MFDLANPIYTDETAARDHLEAIRWPEGPTCPHCGEVEQVHRLEGKATRAGLLYCRSCRGQFSVTVGTVFERSHVPLNKWVLATHLLCASKKGVSAHQLHRMLGVTYKTAWFMAHRIREAMRDNNPGPLGGEGKVVEADETYFGDLPKHKAPKRKNPDRPKFGPGHKRAIVSLVERGGEVRSFYAEKAKVETVAKIVRTNIDRESQLHTDESAVYVNVGKEFAAHERVNHGQKEYARGSVTTNTIESFFSVFKNGMRGIYQHCDEQHLHRYLAEFDFRYNNRVALGVNDKDRAAKALKGIEGKRLTYRRTDQAKDA